MQAMQRVNTLEPTNFQEAERYAEKIANSSFCPKDFKGRPGDVLIAMQMGKELGFQSMQALQSIAVVNGRPCIYGDGLMALVRHQSSLESIREWMEGSIKDKTAIAYCSITRRGYTEEIRSFSVEQAIKAGLWSKPGPWSLYPERMLQMRARGFVIRDVYADVLKGLGMAEEVMDMQPAGRVVVRDQQQSAHLVELSQVMGEKHSMTTGDLACFGHGEFPIACAPLSAEQETQQKEHIDKLISFEERRKKAIEHFAKNGISLAKILFHLKLDHEDDISVDDLNHLQDIANISKNSKTPLLTVFNNLETGEIIPPSLEELTELLGK